MLPEGEQNLRVVLMGLPADIAESLSHIVSKRGAVLYIPPLFPILRSLNLIRKAAPNLAFIWTGDNPGTSLLEAVRRAEPQLPTVAVNSYVKSPEILDALDSGAVDYCIPPFDFTHIQRLLQANDKIACC